jgi:hypothetical protein
MNNEDDFQSFVAEILKGCETERQIRHNAHHAVPAIASSSHETVLEVSRFAQNNTIRRQQQRNALIGNKMALQTMIQISTNLFNDPSISEKIKTIAINTIANLRDNHVIDAEEPDVAFDSLPIVNEPRLPSPVLHSQPIYEPIIQEQQPSFNIEQPIPEPIMQDQPEEKSMLGAIVVSFKSFYSYIASFFKRSGTKDDPAHNEDHKMPNLIDAPLLRAEFDQENTKYQHFDHEKEEEHFVNGLIAASIFLVTAYFFSKVLKAYSPSLSKSFMGTLRGIFLFKNTTSVPLNKWQQ